jgi:hypothetical protein
MIYWHEVGNTRSLYTTSSIFEHSAGVTNQGRSVQLSAHGVEGVQHSGLVSGAQFETARRHLRNSVVPAEGGSARAM